MYETSNTANKIFNDLNIYVEIFNKNINESDCVIPILEGSGAIIHKKVNKSLDMIIFKEGKKNTIIKALENEIKLVNPLWIDECLKLNSKIDIDKYIVKKSYTELLLENKKRKFDDLSQTNNPIFNDIALKSRKLSTNKNKLNIDLEKENKDIKARSVFYNKEKLFSEELNNSKIESKHTPMTPITKRNPNTIKLKERLFSKSHNKPRKLLALETLSLNDMKSNEQKVIESITKAIKNNSITDSNSTTNNNDLINICSVNLSEHQKSKLRQIIKNLGTYKYIGDNYENLKISDYIVVKNNEVYKETKILYSLIVKNGGHKLISYSYFTDSEEKKKYIPIDNYILKVPFESSSLMKKNNYLPLKGYKLLLHFSVYEDLGSLDEYKKQTYLHLINLLGGATASNIRLCDLCIINKIDGQYIPPHVKILNQDFILDTLISLKLPDFNNFKYSPKDKKIRK